MAGWAISYQTIPGAMVTMRLEEQQPTTENVGTTPRGTIFEVFRLFAWLGITSFGGPIAHLGYFRQEIVVRRKWLDESTYGELVGLCQVLPGPTSSQVGITLGIVRAGLWGGLAAWLGFTLPSAIALTLFAYATDALRGLVQAGWLHGLLVAAVAVVAQAVWGMATTLCPDRPRATLALMAAIVVLLWPTGFGQVVVIVSSGLLGWRLLRKKEQTEVSSFSLPVSRRLAIGCWILLAGLLLGLPLLRVVFPSYPLALFDSFFRVGTLVFGGGHVVLPLLQREVVPPGWLTNDQFLTGYAAAQAVPGPLFTFSAYLGAAAKPTPHGWIGAAIALVAIFLPSFFLVIGMLPFWHTLRRLESFQAALRGINAAVVGILLAALYQPLWTSAIHAPLDVALGLFAFGMLVVWKCPSWLVVLLCALVGGLLVFLR